tara:strand:+ start:51572 stop:51982 length:411 start_codon:yes stop_codon:yes gene_type:complete
MEHSCGIVLFHENKVLLLKYKGGGHWDFPKGHIENNESETETALRELKEETGISEVTLFSDFREIIEYSFRKGRSTIKKQVIYFLGETEETNITLSHEHTNFLWANSDNALHTITYQKSKSILNKALISRKEMSNI